MLVNSPYPGSTRPNLRFVFSRDFHSDQVVEMSLFQFGFSRKKRKNDEREEERGKGREVDEVEEVRNAEEKNPEEISTEKPESKDEGKRVRKYQTTWETDFPWLGFEADKNKMSCKVWRWTINGERSEPVIFWATKKIR